jgi:hypothetical protein
MAAYRPQAAVSKGLSKRRYNVRVDENKMIESEATLVITVLIMLSKIYIDKIHCEPARLMYSSSAKLITNKK